jgi:phosphoadenosine phosphosulfate reductase
MSAIEQNARASSDFDAKLAQTCDLLRQAASDYAPTGDAGQARITQASSLGAEDVVISHLINALALPIPIFVLDTGALHAETLQLLATTQRDSRSPVQVFQPRAEAVLEFVAREGQDAIFKSIALRKACCQIRKMEPLARALADKAAWITGLRREQSGTRADVRLIDNSDGARVKFNPLAHWTWGDVWHFIAINQVAYNPLHDQFYPSIGCAPCTRAISQGEDFRAGRWWWEEETAKECGLHTTT